MHQLNFNTKNFVLLNTQLLSCLNLHLHFMTYPYTHRFNQFDELYFRYLSNIDSYKKLNQMSFQNKIIGEKKETSEIQNIHTKLN